MTTITPTTTPADWLVETIEPLHGQTLIGETTGVQIGLSVIVGEGEGDFLDAVAASTYTPPLLPDEGELEKGAVYTWGEHIVMVRQSHTRTIFPPDQTPALFLFWQPEGDGVPDWIIGEQVNVGTLRRYEGVIYRAIQAHVTQSNWTPPAVPALWETAPDPGPDVPEWQSGTLYTAGDEVAHNDITWQSRRNNNSWEPGTNDSGWLQIAPLPGNWYYLGGEGYPLDWEVMHNGQLWRNTSAGNHWEPGVFGWVLA
jgi:hypothetical protein